MVENYLEDKLGIRWVFPLSEEDIRNMFKYISQFGGTKINQTTSRHTAIRYEEGNEKEIKDYKTEFWEVDQKDLPKISFEVEYDQRKFFIGISFSKEEIENDERKRQSVMNFEKSIKEYLGKEGKTWH